MIAKIFVIFALAILTKALIQNPEKYCGREFQCSSEDEIKNDKDLLNIVCITQCRGNDENCGANHRPWQLNNEQRQYMLDLHNELRSQVATGQTIGLNGPLPPAADMRELVYDPELEDIGICQASSCENPMKHTKCRRSSKFKAVGDCLGAEEFYHESDINITQILYNTAHGFFRESALFTAEHINNFDLVYQSDFGAMAHFSEMVWSTVTAVGCGLYYFQYMSQITNQLTLRINIACNYAPMGNLVLANAHVYKVGEPASDCPEGWAPDPVRGLCVDAHLPPRQKVKSISIPNIEDYCNLNCQQSAEPNLVCTRKDVNCGPDPQCGSDFEFAMMKNSDREFIVDSYNQFRSKIALGQMQGQNGKHYPPAANMKQLSYSEELEKIAQCLAATCPTGTEPYQFVCTSSSIHTDTIQLRFPYPLNDPVEDNKFLQVKEFLNETLYMYQGYKTLDPDTIGFNELGHFQQFFLSVYEEIGCGITYYSYKTKDGEKQYTLYAVCLIGPQDPEYNPSYMYKKGPPASDCPQGWSPNPNTGLCINNQNNNI